MKHVSRKEDLPLNSHLGIFVFTTRYTPGDERSRTHPGHGYPESYDPAIEYIAFDAANELAEWVERNPTKTYTVAMVTPKTVTTKLQVTLS